MRLAVALAFLTIGSSQQAVAADPPAAAATPTTEAPSSVQSPAAPPTTPVPSAAPSAPVAAPADADALLEKRLRQKGYTAYMNHGEKAFCRREEVMGSRLSGRLICMTPDEARAFANEAQNDIEHLQRLIKPCIAGGSKGTMCGN
jgi:hypothetical protein